MQKFILGFLVAIVVLLLAGFLYLRLGMVDPRADIPVSRLEARIAMPSLDASVGRHAPTLKNPLEPTEDTLIAGMKVYQSNCASCHGDIQHHRGMFADALYPRAPQFMEDMPDMPEHQNFYIIEHGIRMSAMPAWKPYLNERQRWQVTTFLSHMDKLPASVSELWKVEAGGEAK
jgi:mono/diheme cytochrome c family protein